MASGCLRKAGRITTHGKPVGELDREIAFLNSLDPKVGVHIRNTSRGKEHEFFGKQDGFEAKFSFRPRSSEENISNLCDAVHFGLPRDIEVEDFSVTGSPVFSHVSSGSFKGKVSIGTVTRRSGYLVLYSGERYSVTSASLSSDVEVYSGTQGVAISNELRSSPFNLVLRFGSVREGRLNTTLGLRRAELARRPIKDSESLRPLNEWVDQVFLHQAMLLEVHTEDEPIRLPILSEKVREISPLLHWWRTVSRLHLVAKFMNTGFVLHEDVQFSEAEIKDVDLAYAILKGGKLQLRALEMSADIDVPLEHMSGSGLFCTTSLAIEIQGQSLGEIPVILELIEYKVERLSDGIRVRIYPDGESATWLSYDDNVEINRGLMRRTHDPSESGNNAA